MADNLTQILDRIAQTTRDLLAQFAGQPNMEAITASYGVQFQELEDMFWDLYLLQALANAEGEQLNQLGIIVDEPRSGKDDDNYRAAIYGRIALNRSHGRTEDIILAMTGLQDDRWQLREPGDATLIMRLLDVIDPLIDPTTFNDALQRIKGGGVEAVFQYNTYDDDNTFRWATGATVEATSTEGWSDVAMTNGGKWSDVVPR